MIVCQQAAALIGATVDRAHAPEVPDYIISHHTPPPFKKSSPAWDDSSSAGGNSNTSGANGREKHVALSGVSLTMMDEEQFSNQNDGPHEYRQKREDVSSTDFQQSQSSTSFTFTFPILPKSPFADSPIQGAPGRSLWKEWKEDGLDGTAAESLAASPLHQSSSSYTLPILPKSPFVDPLMKGAPDISSWKEWKEDGLDGMAAKSLTAFPLHQMCSAEGRPRLNVFDDVATIESIDSSEGDNVKAAVNGSRISIEGRLAEFKSFLASLKAGGIGDEQV